MQFDHLDPSDHYNVENLKYKTAAAAILKNRKIAIFHKMISPITVKLGKVMHIVILTMLTDKI